MEGRETEWKRETENERSSHLIVGVFEERIDYGGVIGADVARLGHSTVGGEQLRKKRHHNPSRMAHLQVRAKWSIRTVFCLF